MVMHEALEALFVVGEPAVRVLLAETEGHTATECGSASPPPSGEHGVLVPWPVVALLAVAMVLMLTRQLIVRLRSDGVPRLNRKRLFDGAQPSRAAEFVAGGCSTEVVAA